MIPAVRSVARRLVKPAVFLAHDAFDALSSKGGEIVPPAWMRDAVSGDPSLLEFRRVGERYVANFIDMCRLRPNERVLDIGCGCGRIAIPLAAYLKGGSYEGFDVVRSLVRWCSANITPRHPNFRFGLRNVRNGLYNPGGDGESAFPYGDGEFDFVFATSVFTHLMPETMADYLSEVGRVLRPGGRCLLTFYLRRPHPKACRALQFTKNYGECSVTEADRAECAVAYDLPRVHRLLVDAGFKSADVHEGRWTGDNPDARTFQDVIVATKEGV